MQGLDWTTHHVRFTGGLDQGSDARALDPPKLAVCKDAQFDKEDGLITRKPYAAAITNIFGGGALANLRRIEPNGNELLVFTKDKLYSLNEQQNKFVDKGTHLAVDVRERTAFATLDDQVDVDRAELGNTIVYVWTVIASSVCSIYVGAQDKTTGAVIVAPTKIASACRPRLVALATRILLFYAASSDGGVTFTALKVLALDPADIGTSLAGAATSILAANVGGPYDVTRILGTDTAIGAAQRNPTTSYEVFKVTAGQVVTQATKARTCDRVMAVSSEPTGTQVQIARTNGLKIEGDLITIAAFADTAFLNKNLGNTSGLVNQIAAAHRSVQNGGQYRCYVFWSEDERNDIVAWKSSFNYVDTGGNVGFGAAPAPTFFQRLGVASRAFDYDGSVYVWMVFAGESGAAGMGEPLGLRAQLQNSYFLLRDDGHWTSKAAFDRAGGFAPTRGRLPGVTLTSGSTVFSWCGNERRIIPLGTDHLGFAQRAPRDITFTFDSNDARRVARIGQTLYVSGGLVLQYDGVSLLELGFPIYPWVFATVILGAGQVDAGKHSYKSTLRFQNATGEQERSTTATGEQPTVGASQFVQITTVPLDITRKTAPRSEVAIELWRTKANPTDDDDFYLVTSKDPGVLTGNNCYIPNIPNGSVPTFNDNFTDANLTTKEANPENGARLPSLCPSGARLIAASDTRVFLAGISDDPHRVFYSLLRGDGQIVSFNAALVFDVPRDGGDITAIAYRNETLTVYRQSAIYEFPGEGFDNIKQGSNFGPARIVSLDVGAISQETVAHGPFGQIFKSKKGWFVNRGGGAVEYIGSPVMDYDSETVLATHVVESSFHVRIVSSARVLIWDYTKNEWGEWTVNDGVHACVWRGVYTYLSTSGPKTELGTYTGLSYGMDVETAWLKPSDLQGRAAVKFFEVLGKLVSSCFVRVRIARDYEENGVDPAYFDDKVWTPSAPNAVLQLKHSLSLPNVQALKIRITVLGDTSAKAALAMQPGGNWTSGGAIATSGTAWAATVQARNPGSDANSLALQVYTSDGADGVEVRDGQYYDGANWVVDAGYVGVRVGGAMTVQQLETAINDQSRKFVISVADPTPGKIITDTNTLHTSATLAGGTTTQPTGEALRLTGLSFELGQKPGLNRRIPALQAQ